MTPTVTSHRLPRSRRRVIRVEYPSGFWAEFVTRRGKLADWDRCWGLSNADAISARTAAEAYVVLCA